MGQFGKLCSIKIANSCMALSYRPSKGIALFKLKCVKVAVSQASTNLVSSE